MFYPGNHWDCTYIIFIGDSLVYALVIVVGGCKMKEYIEGFINNKGLEGKSENTLNTYQMNLRIMFDNIENFNYEEVTKYLASIKTLSTRNLLITIIKQYAIYLNEHHKMGITWHNLIKKTKLPKKHIKNKVTDLKTVEKVLQSQSIKNKAIISMMVSTGMRVSELCDLKFKDVTMFTDTDGEKMGEIILLGKGSKERVVYFSQAVYDYLEEYINTKRKNAKAEDYVFVSRTGSQHTRDSIAKIIKRAFADYQHVTPHMLRHTCGTEMVKSGVNIRTIQEFLGHENISTTEIYTHINNNDKKLAVKSLQIM